eukprot:1161938-Pelagomonas_calceolata.AAC.4
MHCPARGSHRVAAQQLRVGDGNKQVLCIALQEETTGLRLSSCVWVTETNRFYALPCKRKPQGCGSAAACG